MYVPMVAALLLVVPVIFTAGQLLLNPHSMPSAVTIIPIIAKWYVFWAVGVRLILAGLRQMIQPRYTAVTILGIKSEDSLLVVRELGIANTAIGSVGLVTLFAPSWLLAAALAGAIFYGLAGINHLLHQKRNKLQNVAMVSDLFASVVLAVCCLAV
jgi:hypothetical protein